MQLSTVSWVSVKENSLISELLCYWLNIDRYNLILSKYITYVYGMCRNGNNKINEFNRPQIWYLTNKEFESQAFHSWHVSQLNFEFKVLQFWTLDVSLTYIRPWRSLHSLHLKILLYNPFSYCICACEMLLNMSIKSPPNHCFEKLTLLHFPRVVSECLGDDISDKVILHQFCTRQLYPMCERKKSK